MTERERHLKQEALILAGHLAEGEALTARQADLRFSNLIQHLCADLGEQPWRIAQIAVMLAIAWEDDQ